MNRNVTAAILIVLAIGIYVTYTSNKYNEIKAIQEENSKYELALANADKLLKIRDKVNQDYSSISASDKDKLAKMLPSSVDNIRLIIDLKDLAKGLGLTLNEIKASAAPVSTKVPITTNNTTGMQDDMNLNIPNTTIDVVKVTFSVSANVDQFKSLLKVLESNLRIMDVTHISMKVNDTGINDFGVELNTYWLRQL